MSGVSEKIKSYFSFIDKKVNEAYELGNKARKKGFDPENTIAIPLAENMAERVEGLISVVEPSLRNSGISDRIFELEEKYGKLSWKVAFEISLETAKQKFCSFENETKAMEIGIRVGLAYLTLGVVASPLEGFVELKLMKRRDDGKEYFCLMFSGPIRSAGGTAGAVCVILADYIRKHMGYAEYDPSEDEVKRSVTELYDYHDRITNLQYLPSEEEIEFLASNMPIQVGGDASEKIEVSNYKDLNRVETNVIRNGFCLVMGECLCQKAPKLWKQLSKWGHDFGIEQWDFLGDFVKLQKEKKAKTKEKKSDAKIQPDYTYVKDLVAGRPILGFPLRNGAFRLRYGRCRNTGYSSAAIHPALTYILDKYIAIGTQLKTERPGKAASMSVCDNIEGPLVKLKDGEVIRVNDTALAKRIRKDVEEIIYLGDILVNYGDFFNRAHPLVPAGYCEEWWAMEIKKALTQGEEKKLIDEINYDEQQFHKLLDEKNDSSITAETALKISQLLNVPLHPKFNYYWSTISLDDVKNLFKWLSRGKIFRDGERIEKIVMDQDEKNKRNLELLGVPHKLANNEYVVIKDGHAFIFGKLIDAFNKNQESGDDLPGYIRTLLGVKYRDKAGTFIGARMGRPEKAKVRKLAGQPHCLFPVGAQGGRLRCFQSALEAGKIVSDFPFYKCECGNTSVFGICEKCGRQTKKVYFCRECGEMDTEECKRHGKNNSYNNRSIDIKTILDMCLKKIDMPVPPDLIKGVKGTSNKGHIPEHLIKGILRAKYEVPVNKDGTTRYDMTQLAITHFKPSEVGTSIQKLKEIGYEMDIHGNELINEEQVLEIFPQDVILPACDEAPEKGADEVLYNVSKFVDEMLEKLYGEKKMYNLRSKEDLAGHLVVALAPHTSAGIVARIVGFSKTQGFYAHPMLHAATRRDCDGDEASVTLLADAILNFSRQYLPNTRGATQDAPLVLTTKLTPAEVDDMVFDMDVASYYPLEFYEAAMEYKDPGDIKVDQVMERLNTEKQYEGMMFTHDTSSINTGVACSAYKLVPSMEDKLKGQMGIATKIRAVDESQVAKIVIERHFIKDIKGNLRKFSQQQFRCVACNTKYRRPPLLGKCTRCGGKIVFTISEGSIIKYLEPALSLAEHYHLPAYLVQTLELTKRRVEGIFGKEKEKQEALNRWFG